MENPEARAISLMVGRFLGVMAVNVHGTIIPQFYTREIIKLKNSRMRFIYPQAPEKDNRNPPTLWKT